MFRANIFHFDGLFGCKIEVIIYLFIADSLKEGKETGLDIIISDLFWFRL
jgi:hypothetical protein